MPFNMTIRPVAVALIAAASFALFFSFARTQAAEADAGQCKGANSHNRAVAANAMFCLINKARTERGLPALGHDARLGRVARRHSHHMVAYRFFGHVSPKAGKLVTRVKRSGFAPRNRQWWAGENLGFGTGGARSARRIYVGWMNSAIHKQAILYPHFKRMGIGVVKGTPMEGRRGRAFTYVVTFGG
jgi:uncharacterized protein YkwD